MTIRYELTQRLRHPLTVVALCAGGILLVLFIGSCPSPAGAGDNSNLARSARGVVYHQSPHRRHQNPVALTPAASAPVNLMWTRTSVDLSSGGDDLWFSYNPEDKGYAVISNGWSTAEVVRFRGITVNEVAKAGTRVEISQENGKVVVRVFDRVSESAWSERPTTLTPYASGTVTP